MKRISFLLLIIPLILTGCGTLGFGSFEGQPPQTATIAQAEGGATFSYEEPDAASVFIAGDFNGWDAQATPMSKQNDLWVITLDLAPGTYQYKFVVNGSEWKPDPNNPTTADDGFGGQNSVITIGEESMTTYIQEETKPQSGVFPVTFEYQPLTGGKHDVYLAGEFNNWSDKDIELKEENGIYKTTVQLPKGKYAYKFVVDGNWVTDENAYEFVGDGLGGQNSIVFVGNKEDIEALYKVEFFYRPENEGVIDVYLAGSFNGWNAKANKMDEAEDGLFSTTLLLKGGEYQYKFVVNGMDWVTDMSASRFADDGFGGQNSILDVDERFSKVQIEVSDGNIMAYGIPTDQSLETINPLSDTKIEFKARAHRNDLENIYLWKDGEKIELDFVDADDTFDYYHKIIELNSPDDEFDYYFIYIDGGKEYYLLNGALTENFDENMVFHYSKESVEPFFTPDWVKNGIIYQIFCDRFYNGDKSNDQDFTEWYYEGVNQPPAPGKKLPHNKQYFHIVEDWYDISSLKSNPYRHDGKPDWWSFYGGDIEGLRQKLGYLEDLGVTIIYFNPLFEAKSNHKYDAVDYMKLDPHFGTAEEFKEFVKVAHEHGIHVIIDCAFNHTGETFWAFQDALEKGPDSPYWHWYEIKKWPLPDPIPAKYNPSDYYECWWGVGEMPDLNWDLTLPNPAENSIKNIDDADPNWDVVNYILDVAEYWIKDMDCDGFRLDVPNEVPFWFWELFRDKVKSIKPDAYLVGEIWGNATDWVNNHYFDSVMNYAFFKDPVMRFFAMRSCSAKNFDRDIKQGLLAYPTQAVQCMMNLIDSHDTFRYLESIKGDTDKLRLTMLFSMTYVGVPHIWYGDEIGMMGAHDPDCRRPMNWKYTEDKEKVALRDWYKKLIQIRKNFSCLRTGDFHTVLTDGMVYAYKRSSDDCSITVVINNDTKTHTVKIPFKEDQKSAINLLNDTSYQITHGEVEITLQPMSGAILK